MTLYARILSLLLSPRPLLVRVMRYSLRSVVQEFLVCFYYFYYWFLEGQRLWKSSLSCDHNDCLFSKGRWNVERIIIKISFLVSPCLQGHVLLLYKCDCLLQNDIDHTSSFGGCIWLSRTMGNHNPLPVWRKKKCQAPSQYWCLLKLLSFCIWLL